MKFIFKKTTFTIPVYPSVGRSEILINNFNKVIYMECNALNAGPHLRYSLERTGQILATVAQGAESNVEFMVLIIENLL